MRTHYGDPCIHCDTPHDLVAAGPCLGDPDKATPIAVDVLGWTRDGRSLLKILYSDRWDFSGFDFNDLIVEAWFTAGELVDWNVIARYSSASQRFGFDGDVFTEARGDPWVATSYSDPARNRGNQQLVYSWTLPADLTEVPEPGTLAAMIGGLAVFGMFWRKS